MFNTRGGTTIVYILYTYIFCIIGSWHPYYKIVLRPMIVSIKVEYALYWMVTLLATSVNP